MFKVRQINEMVGSTRQLLRRTAPNPATWDGAAPHPQSNNSSYFQMTSNASSHSLPCARISFFPHKQSWDGIRLIRVPQMLVSFSISSVSLFCCSYAANSTIRSTSGKTLTPRSYGSGVRGPVCKLRTWKLGVLESASSFLAVPQWASLKYDLSKSEGTIIRRMKVLLLKGRREYDEGCASMLPWYCTNTFPFLVYWLHSKLSLNVN
jgi:hypothetical protein